MIQLRNVTLICGAGGKTVDIYAVVRGEIGAGLRRARSRPSILGIETVVSLYMS